MTIVVTWNWFDDVSHSSFQMLKRKLKCSALTYLLLESTEIPEYKWSRKWQNALVGISSAYSIDLRKYYRQVQMLCPNQCNEIVWTKFINLKTNMCLEQTTSFIIWRKAPPCFWRDDTNFRVLLGYLNFSMSHEKIL